MKNSTVQKHSKKVGASIADKKKSKKSVKGMTSFLVLSQLQKRFHDK